MGLAISDKQQLYTTRKVAKKLPTLDLQLREQIAFNGVKEKAIYTLGWVRKPAWQRSIATVGKAGLLRKSHL